MSAPEPKIRDTTAIEILVEHGEGSQYELQHDALVERIGFAVRLVNSDGEHWVAFTTLPNDRTRYRDMIGIYPDAAGAYRAIVEAEFGEKS
jgi:hypothetical protein